MDDSFTSMHSALIDVLDDLSSPRLPVAHKVIALSTLEQFIACRCFSGTPLMQEEDLSTFIALQDTFECNVPTRLLGLLSNYTVKLESLVNKGTIGFERSAEATTLASLLTQSLNIIQGIVLIHPGSKAYMGRRYALEVLIDLLLASRHVSSSSSSPLSSLDHNIPQPSSPTKPHHTSPSKSQRFPSSPTKPQSNAADSPHLTSVVLDTLLCVLVDSCPSLRTFEASNGLQAVVKILKRAGTAREVRMKCLEFLYFYLLDETSSSTALSGLDLEVPLQSAPPSFAGDTQASPPPTKTAPSSPTQPKKVQSVFGTRDSSWGSMSSISSSSSTGSSGTSTTATTVSSSASVCGSTAKSRLPPSPSPPVSPKTPPNSTPKSGPFDGAKRLGMLKKEVDYVPMSPQKKSHVPALGISGEGRRGPMAAGPSPAKRPPARSTSDEALLVGNESCVSVAPSSVFPRSYTPFNPGSAAGLTRAKLNGHSAEKFAPKGLSAKTTKEKKDILGGMLGNVDALVEGVKKAGVWGLDSS